MPSPGRPTRAERARALASVPEGSIVATVEDDAVVEAWERTTAENDSAWLAFVAWRDADLPRPLLKELAEQQGAAYSTIREWSSKHRWNDRATAYDRHVDAQRRVRAEVARRNMHDRYARMAVGASLVLIKRIQTLEPDEVSPRLLFEGLRAVQAVEMLARGETPIGEHGGDVFMQPLAALAAETPPGVEGVDDAVLALLEAMEDGGLLNPGERGAEAEAS